MISCRLATSLFISRWMPGKVGSYRAGLRWAGGKSPRNLNIGMFGPIRIEGTCRECNRNLKDYRVKVWKTKCLPTNVFLGVAWITNNDGRGPKMPLIFLSSPTLLIKLICIETASNNAYLWIFCLNFWPMGDHRHENVVMNFCFFDQIRGHT